jgi:hypothetical protein
MKTTPCCTTERLNEITYPPASAGTRLDDWLAGQRTAILARVERDGAVLLRDLSIISSGRFATVAAALFGDRLLSYSNRSTPRTELKGRVYTSTEYPQ